MGKIHSTFLEFFLYIRGVMFEKNNDIFYDRVKSDAENR